MRQIEIDAPLLHLGGLFGMLENLHQGKQCGQTHLVVFGPHALIQTIERALLPQLSHNRAYLRHLDTKKDIPFAILAGAGLEEIGQNRSLFVVTQGINLRKERVHFFITRMIKSKQESHGRVRPSTSTVRLLAKS